MGVAAARLTYEDLSKIPADFRRYELIEGDLFVTAAPDVEHQRKVGRLYRLLADYAEVHDLGEVFVPPCDVVLDPSTVVEPDILMVSKARKSIVKHRSIEGPPDLVEVVSGPSRVIDRFVKRDQYAQFGVPEYWVLDPYQGRLEGDKYRAPEVFGPQDTVESPNFPGLRLVLGSL